MTPNEEDAPKCDSLSPLHSLSYPPRHPTDTALPKTTFCVIRAFQCVPIYLGTRLVMKQFLFVLENLT